MPAQPSPWAETHFDFQALIGSDFSDPDQKERDLSESETTKLREALIEVDQYLHHVIKLLRGAEDESLDWYHKKRTLVSEMLKEVSSIESFTASAMAIPSVFEAPLIHNSLMSTSDHLRKAKQALLSAQSAVAIAAQHHEIINDNIQEIHREVTACAKLYQNLSQIQLSENLPQDLTLEKIVSRVKLTGSSSDSDINKPAVMAFSKKEEAFFENFEQFESKCKPISISVQFLEHRIAEFNQICGKYPSAIADVNNEYDKLRKSWKRVLSDFKSLRDLAIVSRWRLLCEFLMNQMQLRLEEMTRELSENQINGLSEVTDELGLSFKTCSNANTLLHKAMIEHLSEDRSVRERFKSDVLPRWRAVNELLSGSVTLARAPSINRAATPTIGEDGLKPVKMIQRRTPSAVSDHDFRSSSNSPVLGFDLGIGVNPSPNVPISAYKEDRFVDLDFESNELRGTNLQMALLGLQSPPRNGRAPLSRDDSTETLVHPKTPELLSSSVAKSSFTTLLQQAAKVNVPMQTKIPLIVSNYVQMNLPVIKKLPSKGSRIASISPSHPVFISPERRNEMQKQAILAAKPDLGTPYTSPGLQSPPSFTLPKRRVTGRRMSSTSSSLKGDSPLQRSRAPSLTLPADKLSLMGQTTPNLAYDTGSIDEVDRLSDRLSLRSTSPERPGSSIGSRFDESHLVQPIKPTKKAWV